MTEFSPHTNRERSTREVLMIVHMFAPVAGSFVQRTVKLVKYLDREGWRATIVTPNWTGEVLDHDLAAEVPESTVVVRAGEASRGAPGLWRLLERTPGGWRWVRNLRRNLVYPDYAYAWQRAALDCARRLLSERGFEILYSASPPATAHVAAMRLKSEFGIPWVLDFHDPWVDNELHYEDIWGLRRTLDRRLEAKVLRQADVVAANTRAQREAFIGRNGLAPERVLWTPCGYDEEDFHISDALEASKEFNITYTGSFYRSFNPSVFFDCLSRFLREGDAPELRLTLAGKSCHATALFERFPIVKERLDLRGYVRHDQIPKLLGESQLLYLMDHPGGRQVPAKFFEYLRSGRPIIATGDTEGELARILRETGRGRFFLPDRCEDLKRFLAEAHERWRENRYLAPLSPDESIRHFEMQVVARTFADGFERAIAMTKGRREVATR